MKITLRLRYKTRYGQSLFLCGDHKRFGGGLPEASLPLHYVNDEFWEVTVDAPDLARAKTPLNYYYILRRTDGTMLEDFGGDRKVDMSALRIGDIVVIDTWNDLGAIENVYFTEPFKTVLLRTENHGLAGASPLRGVFSHAFNVKAPLLAEDQIVCLLGSAPALGGWNTANPVLMTPGPERGTFTAEVNFGPEPFPVTYKYGIYDARQKKFVQYEDGADRLLGNAAPPGGRVIVNDGFARFPTQPWRGAGVAIPVFSLRSERSFGVGEFSDLPLLADWAQRAGIKLIQILPVNDTSATHTWKDSYPYSGISAFALHPLYLNLNLLAGPANGNLLKKLAPRRERLNALPTVDYEEVMRTKLAFAREIFPSQRADTFASAEYKKFFAENEHWLVPYAAFCVLRDKFGTADFTQWPEHRTYNAKKIRELGAADETELIYFVQFQLHLQLRAAAEYLHSKGIILKGDIAIGVSPVGADVWQQPALFHTDMQAGAPPDAFAAKGQNWGFPTYNWPRMTRDGFDWWKRRFAQMSCYFDAFRIDHILGFFRIWSIPRDAVEGILGYFVPAIPVKPAEFAARGIIFDAERFTRPFINDAVLHEIFGSQAERVKAEFLNPPARGRYSLKREFATQRQVEKYFTSLEKGKTDSGLMEGLCDLISNVILIKAPGAEDGFHFRLGMEETLSFKQLGPDTRARLKELYVDYFFRWQDAGWMREALPKLCALKRVTNMLICGEDLGMVPACVPDVMKQLGLLSLEIQRMPKALGADFSRPANAPYLSVVTPSTHDMSTIRGWWQEDKKLTQKFFLEELRQSGIAPSECSPELVQAVVRQHMESPAMWSIFQLQDLLGMDGTLRSPDVDGERINVPAIVNYYWRYRMHIPLETLVRADDFIAKVKNLIDESGR